MNKLNTIISKTIVKNSEIHGKGLFALKNIQKDQLIGYFKGKKTTKTSAYTLWLSPEHSIEVEGSLKYINHSKTPNVCYYDDLSVVALQDIYKDEELTHDYGDDWE